MQNARPSRIVLFAVVALVVTSLALASFPTTPPNDPLYAPATCPPMTTCNGPTGVIVKCQRERSQALNRFLARRDLLDKLEARARGVAEAALAERARIRRQKRRRSRRAKEKMLAAKRAQSEKKAARRAPSMDE